MPDSTAVPAGAEPVDEAELARTVESHRAPGPFSEPRWVMMRSLLVPGWGQAHNHSWIKAAAIAGSEIWLIALMVDDQQALDDLQGAIDAARESGDAGAEEEAVLAYNERADQLTRRQWWLGGLIAYSMLDAYVDAHFRNFRLGLDHDPRARGGRSGVVLRAGWEWRF
jgi:hypothetical protein